MEVRFVDLRAQTATIKEEVFSRFNDIAGKTAFVSGPFVTEFEEAFSDYLGARHCAGVGSGTGALICALMAIDLKHGDEVILPVNTFIASAEAVSILGGTPVFVDIDPVTYTIDIGQVEKMITPKTRAIMPVHIYGQCAGMDGILDIAKKHGLHVIEDACQAHGSDYKGTMAGTIGHVGCFSFYPGKNLGAWGEAGAVVTDDGVLYDRIMKVRNHGGINKYEHSTAGGNFRMDAFQGAVLSVKLKHLDSWNVSRRKAASVYRRLLAGVDGISLPDESPNSKHVYHLFVIRTARRDGLLDYLNEKGVQAGIHYPVPLHLLKPYEPLGHKAGDFPVAEKAAGEILSIPMYPELTEEEAQYVCTNIVDFFSK